jgi:hypothetical protein
MSSFTINTNKRFDWVFHTLVVLLLTSVFSHSVLAQPDSIDFSKEYDRVFQIRTISNNADAKASIGSGFQVSDDGLIITNYHVVSQYITSPDSFTVRYAAQDGSSGTLELLDFDIISDLALLRHPNPDSQSFALATTTPERGVMSYALGNPGDWGMVMVPGPTNGYVEHMYEKRVLFSGSLNSGMSGGPSLNSDREVVGVNVATAGSQLSFLVPVEKVRNLISRKIKIEVDDYNAEIAKQITTWQRPRLQELIDMPWDKDRLFERNLFGEIRNDFQCWGSSNDDNPERTYDYAGRSCSAGDEIYINRDVDSGQIEYYFSQRTPVKLNKMQFALQQGMSMSADNYSDYQYSTNYQCVSDYLDQDQTETSSYTRMITCVRAYKKWPGLFDSMIMLLNHKGGETVKSHLTIAGAPKDQILSLNRKFAEAVQ